MRWHRSTVALVACLFTITAIGSGTAQMPFGGFERGGFGRGGFRGGIERGGPVGGFGRGGAFGVPSRGFRGGYGFGAFRGADVPPRFRGWPPPYGPVPVGRLRGPPFAGNPPPPRRFVPAVGRVEPKPATRVAFPAPPRSTAHGVGRPPTNPPSDRLAARRPDFVVPPAAERRYVADEILALTTRGSATDLRGIESTFGLTLLDTTRIDLLDGDVRRFRLAPGGTLAGTISALRARAIVVAAEPNYRFDLQDEPMPPPAATPAKAVATTPDASVQYAVAALRLTEAHALAEGDDVRVAIIDSGIDETNPELAGMVADRFDAVGGVFAAHPHGTAMAGTIVAHKSLIGIAPKARLIAIRAFSGNATVVDGTGFDILRGLDFAASHGARIVSMSFAGPRDLLLGRALGEARRRGIVTIAAAGNGGPWAKPQYPAAEPGVIAVTATDADGKVFPLANRGAYVALAAPGVKVMAPGVGGGLQFCSGTSIATAEISGVAALLLQRRGSARPDDIRRLLSLSAHPLAIEPAAAGAGVVDAEKAVLAATGASGGP